MENKFSKKFDKKTLDIFVSITREKAKEEIKKEQSKLTRQLTKEEKDLIARRVARRTRGRAALISMFAIGTFTGIKGNNLLEAAKSKGIDNNKNEISINAEETDKDIKINNVTNDRNIFVNGIKVELDEIDINETNYNDAQEKVNALETPEDVLSYLKNEFVNSYNEENEQKINADNVELRLIRDDMSTLYSDKAENGDTIVRKCTNDEYKEMGNIGYPPDAHKGIIIVMISKDKDYKIERFTYESNKYVHVYNKDEEVQSEYDSAATKMGEVLNDGINYLSVLENEKNSWEDIKEYKQSFINSLAEYHKQKNEKENIESVAKVESEDLEIND